MVTANSTATITGSFSDSCRDFETLSSKDISHVELNYPDGRVAKDEEISSPLFLADGGAGDEIDFAIVKSGTTEQRFVCDNAPPAACSDGIDNDGNGLTDFPADPGCLSPEDEFEVFDDDGLD